MRLHPYISENVRNLLLNPDFLESVFGASIEHSDADSGQSAHALKDTKCSNVLFTNYTEDEISRAKYVLLHLDEDWGLFSENDVKGLKKRIFSHLNS